ncbi:hypothetical protein MKX03_018457 [Papaver bracteatum]|nr:hypothetical protein MKX03_018457 [Papaver bracteatum]
MNLKISLPQLKHFEFNSPEEECNCEVTLHAPSLSSFIFNSHLSTSFTLENLSSLVTADVEINVYWKDQMPNSCAQRLMRFFRGLHKVKILTLRHSFIKALESVSLQIPQECYYDPREYPHFDEVKINHENVEDYWYAGLSSQCMICHLKFVEIDGLRGCIYELKFLEILLKHATVLEKVALAYHSTTKQDWLREKRMKKFNEMLLTFPRASKNINFLFKFSKVTLPSSFW